LLTLANKYNVKTIIASDVHYAYPEDAELQDTLIAINQRKDLSSSFKLDTRTLYYASSEDIYDFNKNFGYNYSDEFIEYCFDNTLAIAEKCNFDFEMGQEKYPRYEPTQDVIDYFKADDTETIINKMAFAKLAKKIANYRKTKIVEVNNEMIEKYYQRLKYEIKVISDKKMLDYFLVNWEIIRDYRNKGYEIGPARGSAAGSLLSWVLDITKIDPIRFNLYFERFLNPTRQSPPDLDIDYQTGTDDVTNEFLINKYGRDRILNVSTFSTFSEKNTLKDVVRAHHGQEATGYNSVVFQVTKEMPDWAKVDYTLKDWFEQWPLEKECSPSVREWLTNPDNRKILNQTIALQGQIKGIGQHAAGVVITPTACWEHVPTNIIAKQKSVVTAFQESDGGGHDLSTLGILKLDRLKLETLNVVQDAIKIVKQSKGVDITHQLDNLDLYDKNLYAELRLGMNHGIFQFESAGMNKLIRDIQVESFDELIAANALYRPGPMGIGAHDEYVKNKFDPENIKYIHPTLESILGESNGVLVFQEQVMFIANKIGGMSLGEGDMLRRAMDKASKLIAKKAKGELLEEEQNGGKYQNFLKYWGQFLNGALKNGYSEDIINQIKEWMLQYLGYSFNKSHCVSYSYVACQTLFLKKYYPTEFYTSLLNHPKKGSGKNAKEKEQQWLASTIVAAMSKGIEIVPPSRKTRWQWTMTGEKEISVGLSAINGFGEKAYDEMMKLLEFESTSLEKVTLSKFFSLPFSAFNKGAFGACVKAGVFDEWSESREHLLELKQKKKAKRDPRQRALFDLDSEEFNVSLKSTNHPPTPYEQKRAEFAEVCQFDLDKIKELSKLKTELAERAGMQIESILNFSEDGFYFFFVEKLETAYTVKGNEYLIIKVGDGIGTTRLRVFPPRQKRKESFMDKMIKEAKPGGVYVSEFVQNEGGFINFKDGAKFGRIK